MSEQQIDNNLNLKLVKKYKYAAVLSWDIENMNHQVTGIFLTVKMYSVMAIWGLLS